jgi:hypothetical protein
MKLEASNHTSLCEALVGSKQTRMGTRPSSANLAHLATVCENCVAEERPIQFVTMWGGIKGYNQHDIRCADFLDLMALKRIMTLNEDVRRFHEPGIALNIFLEDFTEEVLGGYIEQTYHDTLVALIEAVGIAYIKIIKESTLIPAGFADKAEENAKAIMDGRADAIGWQGPIPWSHYLERAATEHPTFSEAELRAKIAIYLGIAIGRYQYGILPRSDLKLSFCPYPDTVPDSMRRGRLEYKVKSSKNSKKAVAPWTSFGLLRESDWTSVSVRDLRSMNVTTDTVKINNATIPVLREV